MRRLADTPTIRDGRLLGSGQWNCRPCGCSEGEFAFIVDSRGDEFELRFDPTHSDITREPAACNQP